jgi:hypothetical protein
MMTETHNGYTFHYSSDLSGKVIICDTFGTEVQIDGDSLIHFFAQYLRAQRIARLEALSDVDLIREVLR